jgi:hypothetical protein
VLRSGFEQCLDIHSAAVRGLHSAHRDQVGVLVD